MQVVHCKEITGRGGDRQQSGPRRYTRVFQLLTDDPRVGTKAVRDFVDLPNYGDAWEELDADGNQTDLDIDVRLVEKRATQSDGDNLQNWTVYCEYVGNPEPLLMPPEVEWTEEKYQETSQKDALDSPVRNSAKDFFEGGLTRDRTRLVVIITQNVLTYDPVDVLDYVDTTNEEVFLETRHPPGFDVGLCKIDSITAKPVFYPNWPNNTDVHYWRRTVKVSIDRRGWDAEILDAGFNKLVTSAITGLSTPIKIIDAAGGHTSVPRPLDGAGNELPLGDNPVYLTFTRYMPKTWALLNLDY